MSLEVAISIIDGQPTFTAIVGVGGNKFSVTREYLAHKVLRDAATREVVGHCFLVEHAPYVEAENPSEDLGAQYKVWELSTRFHVCRTYGDREVMNNYDFAYLDFCRTFGHFLDTSDEMSDAREAHNNLTDVF